MLIFSVTLFYTGLHQVLWSGVYTTSIGFTEAFGEDKKKIAALCGIFFGAGEVLGCYNCNFINKYFIKQSHYQGGFCLDSSGVWQWGEGGTPSFCWVLSSVSPLTSSYSSTFHSRLLFVQHQSWVNYFYSSILHTILAINYAGYIGQPNPFIAYTTGFLMGFSDACFLTQVILRYWCEKKLFILLILRYMPS